VLGCRIYIAHSFFDFISYVTEDDELQRPIKVKVQQALYRPGQALRFPGGSGSNKCETF